MHMQTPERKYEWVQLRARQRIAKMFLESSQSTITHIHTSTHRQFRGGLVSKGTRSRWFSCWKSWRHLFWRLTTRDIWPCWGWKERKMTKNRIYKPMMSWKPMWMFSVRHEYEIQHSFWENVFAFVQIKPTDLTLTLKVNKTIKPTAPAVMVFVLNSLSTLDRGPVLQSNLAVSRNWHNMWPCQRCKGCNRRTHSLEKSFVSLKKTLKNFLVKLQKEKI